MFTPAPEFPSVDPAADIGTDLMRLVEWQVGFGCRYPGSEAHRTFRRALHEALGRFTDRVVLQEYEIPFLGTSVGCTNIAAVFRGNGTAGRGPVLFGTHFDTRLTADNEPSPELRAKPIPGANDGGSGTAVLLYLASDLARLSRDGALSRDVQLALFDAEDVGHLYGNPFSTGAEVYAARPPLPLPAEVVVLDMVGGREMVFDIDAHISRYRASFPITKTLFSLGAGIGPRAFGGAKPDPFKFIISDHAPFMTRGIPSCILIDIDYPEWHTLRDLPDAMDGASLALVRRVLLEFLGVRTSR